MSAVKTVALATVLVVGADLLASGTTDSDNDSVASAALPVARAPIRTDSAEDGAGSFGTAASVTRRSGTAGQISIVITLLPSGVALFLFGVALQRSTAATAATLFRQPVDAARRVAATVQRPFCLFWS